MLDQPSHEWHKYWSSSSEAAYQWYLKDCAKVVRHCQHTTRSHADVCNLGRAEAVCSGQEERRGSGED
jgi:hypothetical protein